MKSLRHPLPPVGGYRPPLAMDRIEPVHDGGGHVAVGRQVCAFCQSHDHRKEECALAPPSSGSDRRPWPYRLTEVCRHFNRQAGCTTSRCRFDHKCWSCGAPDHGTSSCRSVKPESSKPCPPPGPAPHKD